MINKSTVFTITILLSVLILVASYTFGIFPGQKITINTDTKEIFSDAPNSEFSYTDLNGNKVSLEQFLGKVLVVTSWASWSPFSKDELTNLNELATKFNQKEVIILAINRKETKEQAQRFVSALSELNSLHLILDPRDHFYTSIEGYAMPETVIFDRKGNKIKHYRGTFDKHEVEDVIYDLLSN